MKIAVAGTGYVGLSIAVLLAQHNTVKAVDIIPEKVELVRGDSAAALAVELSCDGTPWELPENAAVIVRWRCGTVGGEYDTLPDGTPAYSFAGNLLTVSLAPSVCATAGDVDFQIVIIHLL